MAKPTDTELATALAFVLRKWKEAGASHADTEPFDALLARTREPGTEQTPTPVLVRVSPPPIKAEDPEDDYRPATPTLDSPDEPDPAWAVGTGDHGKWPPT